MGPGYSYMRLPTTSPTSSYKASSTKLGQRASRHERQRFAKLPATYHKIRWLQPSTPSLAPNLRANAPTDLSNGSRGGNIIADGRPSGGTGSYQWEVAVKRNQFLLASIGAVLATPSLAEPAMVDFTAQSVNSSAMFMTSDADGILELNNVWDPIDAAGGPLAGLEGPCFGTARMTGGIMTGNGYCAYKDPDGNTAFIRWWMDNSASPAGAWILAGGTGKWATATGGGLWSDSPGESADLTLTHITGMVDVK